MFGGWFALNGNGEMTGTAWIEESGQLEGPVMLTNTHSVGVVRDAVIAERVKAGGADASGYWWSLPVVAETWDGHLNDINGFHVKPEHVAKALHDATGGPVAEGNVGGGTGMICHEFKCGIGTASRRVASDDRKAAYTVGVLVQANYGVRDTLRIAGVPVGQHLREDRVYTDPALALAGDAAPGGDTGSIIIVVATDAPLLPHQLKRIAKRAGMGLARMGSYAGNGSGDIFLAFSTANTAAAAGGALNQAQFIGNDHLDGLFEATVQATEEAIVNAMVAARDMRGEGGRYAKAIPHDALVRLLKQYRRYHPGKTMKTTNLLTALRAGRSGPAVDATHSPRNPWSSTPATWSTSIAAKCSPIAPSASRTGASCASSLGRRPPHATRRSSTGRATPCCPA